jgi:hypothetical protein
MIRDRDLLYRLWETNLPPAEEYVDQLPRVGDRLVSHLPARAQIASSREYRNLRYMIAIESAVSRVTALHVRLLDTHPDDIFDLLLRLGVRATGDGPDHDPLSRLYCLEFDTTAYTPGEGMGEDQYTQEETEEGPTGPFLDIEATVLPSRVVLSWVQQCWPPAGENWRDTQKLTLPVPDRSSIREFLVRYDAGIYPELWSPARRAAEDQWRAELAQYGVRLPAQRQPGATDVPLR